MKITKFLFAAAICLPFTACTPTQETTEAVEQQDVIVNESATPGDVSGTYFGVLPCASCPGIKTEIKLNADGTFTKKEEYMESGEAAITTNGRYEWSKGNKVLTLDGRDYRLSGKRLSMLDESGRMVTGTTAKNYVLHKQ